MEDYKDKIISDGKLARVLALSSFLIGTLILVTYKITNENNLVVIGFYYVIIALFLNSILFLNLLYNLFIYQKKVCFSTGKHCYTALKYSYYSVLLRNCF